MENAKALNEAGVPSPAFFETIEKGDRLGLIYERIIGPSMFAIMQSSPLKLADCARKMAQLHLTIHRCGTDKLPPQKDLLEKAIRDSSDLLKEKLPVAAARLREKVPCEQKWLLHLINSGLQYNGDKYKVEEELSNEHSHFSCNPDAGST